MATDLMTLINDFSLAVYREDRLQLNQRYGEIVEKFHKLISGRFSDHQEIMETNGLLLIRASELLERNDFMLQSAFLEMELLPILKDIAQLEC